MCMYESELPKDSTVDLSVETFRMLSDATRVKLLWHMRDEERSVSQLVEALGKSQSLVSQHLGRLRQAHLVTRQRHGKQVFYALSNEHVRQLVLDGLFHAEHIGPGTPRHHAEREPSHQDADEPAVAAPKSEHHMTEQGA